VISPFSYLALGKIEELAQRMTIIWRPILFAALPEHWKHLDKGDLSTALSLRGCPGHAAGLRRRA
jgi:hypothetical protein